MKGIDEIVSSLLIKPVHIRTKQIIWKIKAPNLESTMYSSSTQCIVHNQQAECGRAKQKSKQTVQQCGQEAGHSWRGLMHYEWRPAVQAEWSNGRSTLVIVPHWLRCHTGCDTTLTAVNATRSTQWHHLRWSDGAASLVNGYHTAVIAHWVQLARAWRPNFGLQSIQKKERPSSCDFSMGFEEFFERPSWVIAHL